MRKLHVSQENLQESYSRLASYCTYLLEIGCSMQKVCTLVATAGQPQIGRQPTIQKCLAGCQMPTRIALHETKKMKPVLVGLSPKISIKEQGTNDIFDRINHRDCTNKKGASATKLCS